MQTRDPVSKALQLLTAIVEAETTDGSVRDLARTMELPASTVHRALKSLERDGFVEEDIETSRYRVGREFHRLARIATSRFPVEDLCLPYLRELTAASGETSLYASYDSRRKAIMFAAAVDGPHPLRYVVPLNSWITPVRGATGLAVLSFLPESEADAILAEAAETTESALLREAMRTIRERGVAVSHGQRITGAVAVAAPVFSGNRVIGDVAVSLPESRFSSAVEEQLVAWVKSCARQLTIVLGGERPRAEEPPQTPAEGS